MPTSEQPIELLASLAASTLDADEVRHLEDWKAYALGRPPADGDDERLPVEMAALALFIRTHRDELFRRICGIGESAYCGLGRLEGRARKVLVEGIHDLIDGAVDEVPSRLLSAILVRIGLEQYCTCRGVYYCGGVTIPGRPCRHRVGEPGGLCWQHASQRSWFREA